MAVKDKKARFNPFVPPTHFQQQVGWGTRLTVVHLVNIRREIFIPNDPSGDIVVVLSVTLKFIFLIVYFFQRVIRDLEVN